MATSQLELIVNQVKLLPPDDLVKLIKHASEVLEQKQKSVNAAGIDQAQAAKLCASFATFEDWNDAEMDIYNDYENSATNRKSYSFIGIGHSKRSDPSRRAEEILE